MSGTITDAYRDVGSRVMSGTITDVYRDVGSRAMSGTIAEPCAMSIPHDVG